MEYLFTENANKIIAYYCLFLIPFGTISNIIAFFVCINKRLIHIPTFVFYAFIFVFNTLSLYFINISYSIDSLTGIQLLDFDLTLCKIGHFIHYWSAESSAWLMVSLHSYYMYQDYINYYS